MRGDLEGESQESPGFYGDHESGLHKGKGHDTKAFCVTRLYKGWCQSRLCGVDATHVTGTHCVDKFGLKAAATSCTSNQIKSPKQSVTQRSDVARLSI